MFRVVAIIGFLTAGLLISVSSEAQNSPWSFNVEGGGAHQAETDLKDENGAFEVDRWFVGAGVDYSFSPRNSIGVGIGGGRYSYTFDSETDLGSGGPWETANDFRLTLTARFRISETGTAIIVPMIRFNGENDADSGDSRTYGMYAAIAWRINEDLTIGPGFGVFSRLESGTRIFPLLAIDWNINERWNLGTGSGLAASQGPGLTLSYKISEHWKLGLSGRYEDVEFRLDDDGVAPGGIGRDQSFPLIFSGILEPSPKSSLALFAGLELSGKLKLKDSEGELLEESSYDPALLVGATFSVRF